MLVSKAKDDVMNPSSPIEDKYFFDFNYDKVPPNDNIFPRIPPMPRFDFMFDLFHVCNKQFLAYVILVRTSIYNIVWDLEQYTIVILR